jgi:hypothetical protein
MTETLDPKIKLYMQFGLTVLVMGFLGAAWWAGKIPVEAALPLITALIGVWLPGPLSGVAPGSRVLVTSEKESDIDVEKIARDMSIPGSRPRTETLREVQDVRDLK